MQQNELAKLLDISPAMVSRLAKRGMPTDTVERAERWRKRHLEPGRVKGSRFDPNQHSKATAPKQATPAPAAAIPGESLAEIEAAGVELDQALTAGDAEWAAVMLQQVRGLLRENAIEFDPDDNSEPRLSLRVWVALLSYVLVTDGVLDRANNPAELLTPVQFCRHFKPDRPTYPLESHHTLNEACDWQDYSIKGWPSYPDDDKWDAEALAAEP